MSYRTSIEGTLRVVIHATKLLTPLYLLFITQDDDALSIYKIQSSHTIHMVKGAARSTTTASSSTGPGVAPQQLPTMQAGQNVHDPLTQLNSHLGYGAMAGLNPFADMGLNPNDPNMVRSTFTDPVSHSTTCLARSYLFPPLVAAPDCGQDSKFTSLSLYIASIYDELAGVLPADVVCHVESSCSRPNHRIKPATRRHGSSST